MGQSNPYRGSGIVRWMVALIATVSLAILPVMIEAGSAAAAPSVAATTWTALVSTSYPGYAANESYSLRGVAVSPDGSGVYGTWLHTGRGIVVDEYNASTGALMHSSAPIPGTDGVDYVQSKSIAVDSRGYVFTGSGDVCYDDYCDFPFIQAYSADLQTTYGSVTTQGNENFESKRFGGLATLDYGFHHYLYATRESGTDGFYIQRFITDDVNHITLDHSFGTDGTFNLQDVAGYSDVGYPHGIVVAGDGTMYVASFDEHGNGIGGDPAATVGTVYKISPNGQTVSSASVPGAFSVALLGSRLYVSEYGEGSYPAVTVLNASTLATEDSFYTGFTNTSTSRDSGYSGIAISPQGKIYLADQFYSSPGYSDRLLVSSPQPIGSPFCSSLSPYLRNFLESTGNTRLLYFYCALAAYRH